MFTQTTTQMKCICASAIMQYNAAAPCLHLQICFVHVSSSTLNVYLTVHNNVNDKSRAHVKMPLENISTVKRWIWYQAIHTYIVLLFLKLVPKYCYKCVETKQLKHQKHFKILGIWIYEEKNFLCWIFFLFEQRNCRYEGGLNFDPTSLKTSIYYRIVLKNLFDKVGRPLKFILQLRMNVF